MFEAIPLTLNPERPDKVETILNNLIRYDNLFNHYTPACDDYCGRCDHCTRRKLIVSHNLVSPKAAVFEVWNSDDIVGILWLANIVAGQDARGEFTFWDGKLQGKRQLIENWLCGPVFGDPLRLHRVSVEIPEYMEILGRFLQKKLGFKAEGRKREAVFKDDKWYDVLLYGRVA